MKELKVAIVTEFINSIGGSDRVIESLLLIFPQAEIYTSTFSKANYPNLQNKVHVPKFFGSILKWGIGRRITVLLPFLFEQFDLRGFDLVISVSAGASKGVITYPSQKHISIICTPPRHQWDNDINVRGSILRNIYYLGSKIISSYIRIWDVTAVKRVDHIISISNFIRRKVFKRYRRNSKVIYPGIKAFWFKEISEAEQKRVKEKYNLPDEFNLVVSRLFDYKHVDWAIRASIEAGQNLVVVGRGPDLSYLKKIVRKNNKKGIQVIFLDDIDDQESHTIHKLSSVLLFCGIEDFGLIPVEAMASGSPVFAFNVGGLNETVVEGKTGFFFSTYDELVKLLKKQLWSKIKPEWCIIRARKFTEDIFISEITDYIKGIYEKA
ncbi:glycosyltransferase [Candidatus Dojkabacteria bacterium]|nr:glycosyltransferase [Candidatus Dojkabacteria bacterium]